MSAPWFAKRTWLAVVACATGCIGGGGGAGGGGGTGGGTGSTPAVSGGAVGATCQPDGAIGCGPGANTRVECKAGAWAQVAACPAGQGCVETKDAGGTVTATVCTTPLTANSHRASACARAAACVSKVNFHDCMNPIAPQIIAKQLSATNLFDPTELLPQLVEAQAGCLTAAKDCDAVKACLAGNVPNCTSNSDDSCVGSVARVCSSDATLALDCAKVGLQCQFYKTTSLSMLVCGTSSACSKPGDVSCSGSVVQGCVGLDKASGVTFKLDCGVLGGVCAKTPEMSFDKEKVCTFGGGGACTEATHPLSCNGNVLNACVKGTLQQLDCGKVFASCLATTSSSGKPQAECTTTPLCTVGTQPKCDGDVLRFCDGNAGYRGFACSQAGLKCQGSKCVFPKP